MGFTASRALRAARRVHLDARRLAVAAALAGWSSACGGRVDELSGAAFQAQVAGSCPADGVISDGVTSCDMKGGCTCGPAGYCGDLGGYPACVPRPCADGEYRDDAGACVAEYWFEGKVPPDPSQGGCYGAPPARA